MAYRASQIPTGCTSNHTGRHLGHLAENIYETYCCIRIATIPAADFIGRTATSGNAGLGVLHDLNVYSQCAGWRFTERCYGKLQSFETSHSVSAANLRVAEGMCM